MVANTWLSNAIGFWRLHHHEVDPDRKTRQPLAAGQAASIEKPTEGGLHAASLSKIERFLRKSEVAPSPPAHLDGDELSWWPRIDRQDVQLAPPRADVAADDRPASAFETLGDHLLSMIARLLGPGSRSRRPC
jgi:hypothetical protein